MDVLSKYIAMAVKNSFSSPDPINDLCPSLYYADKIYSTYKQFGTNARLRLKNSIEDINRVKSKKRGGDEDGLNREEAKAADSETSDFKAF